MKGAVRARNEVALRSLRGVGLLRCLAGDAAREPVEIIVAQPPRPQRVREVIRQRRREFKLLAGYRVRKREPESVQCLAREARRGSAAIKLIGNKRVPDVRHVHADLVGAPGAQRRAHKATLRAVVNHLKRKKHKQTTQHDTHA